LHVSSRKAAASLRRRRRQPVQCRRPPAAAPAADRLHGKLQSKCGKTGEVPAVTALRHGVDTALDKVDRICRRAKATTFEGYSNLPLSGAIFADCFGERRQSVHTPTPSGAPSHSSRPSGQQTSHAEPLSSRKARRLKQRHLNLPCEHRRNRRWQTQLDALASTPSMARPLHSPSSKRGQSDTSTLCFTTSAAIRPQRPGWT
jgi:hypothetical protein